MGFKTVFFKFENNLLFNSFFLLRKICFSVQKLTAFFFLKVPKIYHEGKHRIRCWSEYSMALRCCNKYWKERFNVETPSSCNFSKIGLNVYTGGQSKMFNYSAFMEEVEADAQTFTSLFQLKLGLRIASSFTKKVKPIPKWFNPGKVANPRNIQATNMTQ